MFHDNNKHPSHPCLPHTGKLQVALIRGGHCLQEEEPVAVAGHVARFIHRSLTINTVNAAPHR